MTDTPRKTAMLSDPAATILARRDALLAERATNRRHRAELAARDREIDRELADCQAAGRVFGVEVEVPRDEEETRGFFQAWEEPNLTLRLRSLRGRVAALQDQMVTATAAAKAVATKAEMPRVSDIVLDRLKEAGDAGSKAAPIQAYIESTYSKKIHDKTVGMTLYRLQQEGRVRRQGHTWFIVPETVNPAGGTAGLDDLLK